MELILLRKHLALHSDEVYAARFSHYGTGHRDGVGDIEGLLYWFQSLVSTQVTHLTHNHRP